MFNPSIQTSVGQGASVGGTRTCFAENRSAGELEGQGSAASTCGGTIRTMHHAVGFTRYTRYHCTLSLLSSHLWKLVGVKGSTQSHRSDSFLILLDSDNLVKDKHVLLAASTMLRLATLLGPFAKVVVDDPLKLVTSRCAFSNMLSERSILNYLPCNSLDGSLSQVSLENALSHTCLCCESWGLELYEASFWKLCKLETLARVHKVVIQKGYRLV